MQHGSSDNNNGDVAEKVNIMDGYLKGLLSHWLGVGLLKLELLTWHSPASLLEKVYFLPLSFLFMTRVRKGVEV